jgi:hypothetical protein
MDSDQAFGAAVRSLLDLAGVPVNGQVMAARTLPPAEHLCAFVAFGEVQLPTLARAREFAEAERVLYERMCRQLAETRGVRALQFLHGGSNAAA